jgi:hypothetical protein
MTDPWAARRRPQRAKSGKDSAGDPCQRQLLADGNAGLVLVRRDRRCHYPPRAASCAAVRSAFAIASICATVMFA